MEEAVTLTMEFYVSQKDADGANGAEADRSASERDGSHERPWKDLAQARDGVRRARAAGFAGPVTVWIGDGRYGLDEPLRFDARDSGCGEMAPTTYAAEPGAGPILTGGRRLTAWEAAGGGVYRCFIGPETLRGRGYTLFENGVRAGEARSPKQGYHAAAGKADGDARIGFRFAQGDVPRIADPANGGLKVFIWPGEGEWNWFTETKPVASVDWDAGTIAFREPAPWGIDQGSRYRVQGARELLTEPGEFVRDEREGWLYYMPRSLPIEEQEIVLPVVKRVLDVDGGGSAPGGPADEGIVRDLAFRGLTVELSDFLPAYRMPEANREREEAREALVRIENAERVTIADCVLRHGGVNGVLLNGHCRNARLLNNVVEHVGQNGIYAVGFAPGEGAFGSAAESDVNNGHVIAGNAIRAGGELIGHGSGIQLYQSGGCAIERNVIRGMPRYGISLKGRRFKAMEPAYYGTEVTWENHWAFLHARNNLIAGNDISDVMTDSQDGGMFEAWGPGLGNRLVGNRFHDSGIHFSVGYAIYLDDAADGFLVSRNVVHDLYGAGKGSLWFVVFAKGIGNVVENNLFVRNGAKAAFGTQEMAGEPNRGLTVRRNAVIDSGEQLYHFINWTDDRLKEADFNLFYRSGGEAPTVTGFRGGDTYGKQPIPWEEWRALLGGRFDAHTAIAPPLLEEPERGRFRFRPEAPVWALGWRPLEAGGDEDGNEAGNP
ncbi:Right handed beta helix region [Paenibacillus sp. UNC496MF]|uniref:right-handed parallel beta-helix repeat-containing protein n=1 Tax=Paenibacillus sp. UNC496MF TaxID=1502753 RepID=UPI0008F1CBA9|nr:right-handed parallel beta-helix repeat-containing protein [Paenibacillus sp. UNC496MF]SFI87485.1 Right handed beta helix region [Paenibacillus sp. UNC496MF]